VSGRDVGEVGSEFLALSAKIRRRYPARRHRQVPAITPIADAGRSLIGKDAGQQQYDLS